MEHLCRRLAGGRGREAALIRVQAQEEEEQVKALGALATCLSLGCALAPGHLEPVSTPVWVRSHNRSPVDVYLMCGDRDARWLGTVGVTGSDAFEIPAGQSPCVQGLNFFLVVQNFGRGYWVGPFRPLPSQAINLVIEKYAGLSTAQVLEQ
jgi:hypothetical protein